MHFQITGHQTNTTIQLGNQLSSKVTTLLTMAHSDGEDGPTPTSQVMSTTFPRKTGELIVSFADGTKEDLRRIEILTPMFVHQ